MSGPSSAITQSVAAVFLDSTTHPRGDPSLTDWSAD